MLTWAIAHMIKSGIAVPVLILFMALMGDTAMVVSIAAAFGGAWR